MKRLAFIAGAAAGYVLGTRAGQQRYEQLKAKAEKVWSSDQVQHRVEVAKQTLAEKAPVVAEKVGAATRSAGSGLKDKVQGGDASGGQGGADSIDLTTDQAGSGTLGSATLGQGVTGDDQRAPGMGPGGDRLP
jgi:hypothetical protein